MAEITSRHDTEAPTDLIEIDDKAQTLARGWQDELGPPLPSLLLKQGAAAPPAQQAIKIARTLALFSDGTGNSSAKAEKTNVWRMFQAIEQSTSDQLAMYDDGVGTSSNKYLAAIGGAVGWGLKRNVIDLYKFVCRNYVDQTTKIYAFGFSRGAYTIRVLTSLITHEGLVDYTSEEDLHKRAEEAYDRCREACIKPPIGSPVFVYRSLRRLFSAVLSWSERGKRRQQLPPRKGIEIEFLGLWDTVSAYGMPIAELKPVINWLFWPMDFADLKLSGQVKRACHALSLDDERTTFHPIVWDRTSEADQRRITQVWFAGVHSNLGGGYPEDQLSLVSLDWMMHHAQEAGLKLQPECVKRVSSEKSAFARIYDSRHGMAGLFRYSPRTIRKATHAGVPVLPVIHGSVIARMARGADGYVPNSLPPKFLVLAPNGELLPMAGYADPVARHNIQCAPPPTSQILNTAVADERTLALKQAMAELDTPDAASMAPIRNTIWWRRIAWSASAALAALLVVYPWFAGAMHGGLDRGAARNAPSGAISLDAARDAIVAWDMQLSGTISQFDSKIPDLISPLLAPWTRAVSGHPVEFALVAVLFLASLRRGQRLRVQLREFALLAWHVRRREPFRRALLASEKQTIIRSVLATLLVDAALFAMARFDVAAELRLQLAPFVAGLNVLVGAQILFYWRFRKILRNPKKSIASAYFRQHVAQALRTNPIMRLLSVGFRKYLVPLGFGAALLYAAALIVERAMAL
jgi:uncharacterized protein (DUF2235 family)